MSNCPTCGKPAEHLRLEVPMRDDSRWPWFPEVVHLCPDPQCATKTFKEPAQDPERIVAKWRQAVRIEAGGAE